MSGQSRDHGGAPPGGSSPEAPSVVDLFDLGGKVALVTGGAMGIGEAIALRLAAQGAHTMIADVNVDAARKVVRRIESTGGQADAVKADAGSPTDPEQAVSETARRMGDLHILVNNAGIFPFSAAAATPVELWDRVLAINLRGAFLFAQAAARTMSTKGHGGSIVNIASIDAFRPTGNLAHYDASKGGLVMLTRSLALEWGARKIRVNAIAPGMVNTPGAQAVSSEVLKATGSTLATFTSSFLQRIPIGRAGEPDGIARAVLFLATPASDYVTGSVLVVDGGYLTG